MIIMICFVSVSKKDVAILQKGGKIKDLQRLVNECKGERHDLIIMNQKEALNELRLQIKQLGGLPKSNKTEMLLKQKQEKIINDKNMAECRARSALADIEPLTVHFHKQKREEKNKEENYSASKFQLKEELKVRFN